MSCRDAVNNLLDVAMAAALSLGSAGVWVGTRFVASVESHASDRHKQAVVKSGPLDTIRTVIYSGRPLRTLNTDYVKSWEVERKDQIEKLCNEVCATSWS